MATCTYYTTSNSCREIFYFNLHKHFYIHLNLYTFIFTISTSLQSGWKRPEASWKLTYWMNQAKKFLHKEFNLGIHSKLTVHHMGFPIIRLIQWVAFKLYRVRAKNLNKPIKIIAIFTLFSKFHVIQANCAQITKTAFV